LQNISSSHHIDWQNLIPLDTLDRITFFTIIGVKKSILPISISSIISTLLNSTYELFNKTAAVSVMVEAIHLLP